MSPQIFIEKVQGQPEPLNNTGLLPKFVELGKALNLPRTIEIIELCKSGDALYVQAAYQGGDYAGGLGYSSRGRFQTGGDFIDYVPASRLDALYNPDVPRLIKELAPHVPAQGVLRAVGLRVSRPA